VLLSTKEIFLEREQTMSVFDIRRMTGKFHRLYVRGPNDVGFSKSKEVGNDGTFLGISLFVEKMRRTPSSSQFRHHKNCRCQKYRRWMRSVSALLETEKSTNWISQFLRIDNRRLRTASKTKPHSPNSAMSCNRHVARTGPFLPAPGLLT